MDKKVQTTKVNWETINELRNNFIEDYVKTKRTHKLESEFNYEKSLIDDYNGRQLLELLQNVDDAYRDKVSKSSGKLDEYVEVDITFEDNILSIGNTGTAFTPETIERLCEGGASSKSYNNIGNKGIGFRSLLNDAEWIELYSADFSLRFSEDFSNKCFEKYSHFTIIQDQLAGWVKDYPLSFPVMRCPEKISKLEHKYDTLIRIKVKEENETKGSNSIKAQLEQPFYKSLLFLPYINQIKIKTDDATMKFSKISDKNNSYIEIYKDDELIEKNDYILRKKIINVNDKEAELIIAVPEDLNYDYGNEKLYCYFPIRNALTPINAIIHAPFKTNSSRDNISPDNKNINRIIFIELQKFIKETAEHLAKENNGTLASNMVTLRKNYALWAIDAFNLNDKYLDLLSSAKILETVNNDFISINDKPKQIKSNFPLSFKGEFFCDLLKHIKSNRTKEFIESVALHSGYEFIEFEPEDLKDRINMSNAPWTKEINIDIFIWWSENINKIELTPNLLFNSENKFVKNDDIIFLPTSTGISEAPKDLKWVKLCILNHEDITLMITQIKSDYPKRWQSVKDKYTSKDQTGEMRILSSYSDDYFSFKFREQASAVQMISTINTQIDTFEKSKSFTLWFFKNYSERIEPYSTLSSIQFRFPTNNNEFTQRNRIYIGLEYDNELALKLFENSEYVPLYDFKSDLEENKVQSFIEFILKCGVIKYPLFKLEDLEDYRFLTHIKYDTTFLKFIKNKYSYIYYNINYLTTGYIYDFDRLIKNLETDEIVEWFDNDHSLNSVLKSKENNSVVKQQHSHYGDHFPSNEYIRFVLNKTRWINIDGKKYSPNDIILYDRLGTLVPNLLGIKVNELIKLIGKDLYENLNFRKKLSDYEDNQIHTLLQGLSNLNGTEIVSRKLYREIILNKKDTTPRYRVDDFEVLCKDGYYYNTSEVMYADKKVSYSVQEKFNFIDINVRLSIETIQKWLNVERYIVHYQYKHHIPNTIIEQDFAQELIDIKTCVKAVIDDNEGNVYKTKRVTIVPCNEIVCVDIDDGDIPIEFEDYFYIEKEGIYYLKIPTNISDINTLRKDVLFTSTIVEIFKQALTLEIDENLIELLVSRDKIGKKAKIHNSFGIDRWSEAYKILFDEDPLNIKVYEFFENCSYTLEKHLDFTSRLDSTEVECLIRDLNLIGKDVCNINNLDSLLNIDLRTYWLTMINIVKETHQEEYENKLFYTLLNQNKEEQKQYFNYKYDYYSFTPEIQNIENSVYFDLNDYLSQHFPVLEKVVPERSYKNIYKNNYEQLNPENQYSSDISNDDLVRVYIYFNWEEEFKEWLSIKKKEYEKPEKPENEIYLKYKNVIPVKVDIEHKEAQSKKKHKKKRETSWSDEQENKKNRNKKIKGNSAELLVYNALCDLHGEDNVTPISEAFVTLGKFKAGQSKSGNYDIKYKDDEGKTFFVEVKSGEGNKFTITESELSFAKENSKSFKLYLVQNFESNPPQYVELPLKFWTDDKYRVKEVIEKYDVDF